MIGYALRLAVAGIAIGGVSVILLTRVLTSFSQLLYGVGVNDPLRFLATSLVRTAVAFIACCVPARRATRVDPMAALRCE